MNQLLMSLGGLTLGGSAVILVLALAGRSTRARYGARWRGWGWGPPCPRLALPGPPVPPLPGGAPPSGGGTRGHSPVPPKEAAMP